MNQGVAFYLVVLVMLFVCFFLDWLLGALSFFTSKRACLYFSIGLSFFSLNLMPFLVGGDVSSYRTGKILGAEDVFIISMVSFLFFLWVSAFIEFMAKRHSK